MVCDRRQAHWSRRPGRAACLISAMALAAAPLLGQDVQPSQWPVSRSPEFLAASEEARIDALLKAMSVEEKVGQLIQADIETIKPEDLREIPLGSILAGGNSGPFGNERGTAADWKRLVNGYRAVSSEQRRGHVPVPIIFGVDGVHGHSNLPGAVIFPHNIGLAAQHRAWRRA
jgi:beta-glucosidase